MGARAEEEPPSPGPAGRGPGRAGERGDLHPTPAGAGRDALWASGSLRSEATGRWDLRAGCCFLPALGKRKSGRGASAGGPRSALSGAGAESRAPRAPAPRSPPQQRNRKVHASYFNFSRPRIAVSEK